MIHHATPATKTEGMNHHGRRQAAMKMRIIPQTIIPNCAIIISPIILLILFLCCLKYLANVTL